jgi:hypothetical protein
LTGATVAGKTFSAPSRCANTILNEWGEFDVQDYSCVVEYPLRQVSWLTYVAIALGLVIVIGLLVLRARFFPKLSLLAIFFPKKKS